AGARPGGRAPHRAARDGRSPAIAVLLAVAVGGALGLLGFVLYRRAVPAEPGAPAPGTPDATTAAPR
ncbi:MAG: hypothetical protein HY908_16805, partial [Myxococcales bacterium]|nr:hypothetical protein [Myxococcales bacterium]